MRICAALCVMLVLTVAPAVPLRAAASPTIRVGILREQERIALMSDRPIDVLAGPLTRATLPPAAYEVIAAPGGVEVVGAGQFDGALRFVPTGGARLFVAIKPYRGVIEIRRTPSGRLTVINELDLEEYLYGVLKMEVDPRWPAETLKAQAVAARTLALYSMNRFQAEGYDVRATTDSQVYGGVAAEDPRATAAVDETRGQVITFQGRPIFAAFHSDSGGHTESSERVWGGTYAYLKSVSDPYSTGAPSAQWIVRMDLVVFEERLRRTGKPAGGITAMEVVEVSPSGRAQTLRVTSGQGVVTLKGTELRTIIGADLLRSTLFTVRLWTDEQPAIEFTGRGAGHGVGMSQWGARGQGALGRTYREILQYYYAGITIETR